MQFLLIFLLSFYCSTFLACDLAMDAGNSQSQVMNAKGNRRKVDEQGQYVPFKGVTIVADVAKTDVPFFTELYDALAQMPTLKNYYAPLPVSSYHMTTHNLFIKTNNKSWDKTLISRKNDFKDIAARLTALEVKPEISLQKITVGSTVKLVVNVQEAYENEMRSIAKDFGIENKIPAPLHITLGYLYQDIPKEFLESLQSELTEILTRLLLTHNYMSKTFILDDASLRYFNDMTEFLPWDGENDPF